LTWGRPWAAVRESLPLLATKSTSFFKFEISDGCNYKCSHVRFVPEYMFHFGTGSGADRVDTRPNGAKGA